MSNICLKIDNLSFTYPECRQKALSGVDLTIEKGSFAVLCGPSGCGKSTLLRQLKTVLAPHGTRTGSVFFGDVELDSLDLREQSSRIGFVQQSPENQIVTDKVWHELAFGLESLGLDTPTIRRRVAEMASFFGIQTWFYKNVTELSGGQKQLLNLASIMVMQPELLILDEPTSQLDPIAASDFLATLGKINRELGTTVLLTEHRLEEAFPLASSVAVMDRGEVICTGTPEEVGLALRDRGHGMFLAMPAAMRVWASVRDGRTPPVTVPEGRNWLSSFAAGTQLKELPAQEIPACGPDTVIEASEVWFKYEKDLPDVVKGLSVTLRRGEFLAVLGGNGTGKSTSLKNLAGLLTPYRGEIKLKGRAGVLPQDPQTLFVKKTVREDLAEIFGGTKTPAEEKEVKISRVVRLCMLEELLDRHPYDLSGGEQQRAALAKVLLLDPEILFLDEPTKGLDAEFKQTFAGILRSLLAKGVSVFMVSHDVEFCARHAHRCALFFDGSVVAEGSPREFFSGNSFYTTSANRMARGIAPGAVTPEDLMAVCGGEVPPEPELPDDGYVMAPRQEDSPWKKPPLPLWRKLTAAVSGAAGLFLLVRTLRITDLSALISEGGLSSLAGPQGLEYAALIAALVIFALSIGRRSKPPVTARTPAQKRKLSRRTVAAAALIVLLIPATLFAGEFYMGGGKYYFISLLVLIECMVPFFLIFEGRKPQARELVLIASLCAIGVAGRAAFFMLPQFKPVMAVVILSGVALGAETGFLVGAVTMLVSNMLFGQTPLTPWQMFAMGIIGFLSGLLFRKGLLRRTRGSLCVFGALCAIIIYGGIMNPASALMWSREISWKVLLTYYIPGFPMDCVHAAATWVFLWLAAEPMLEKLDRIKVKYGLVE